MSFDPQATQVLDQLLVRHEPFVNARSALDEVYEESEHYADKSILPLIGPSRSGKTRLLEDFANQHYGSTGKRAILRTALPASKRKSAVLMQLLAALGDPLWECGSEDKMLIRLVKFLLELEIKFILADEFQHCVSPRGDINYEVADVFKVLLDDARVTIVASGLERTADVLSANEQLEGRCLQAVRLPRFDWNDPDSRADFMGVIDAFSTSIPGLQMPNVDDESWYFRWFVATGGLVGYVHKIFRKLLTHLKHANRMTVSSENLHRAHMAAIYYRQGKLYPFDPSFDILDKVTGLTFASRIGERRDVDPDKNLSPTSKGKRAGVPQ